METVEAAAIEEHQNVIKTQLIHKYCRNCFPFKNPLLMPLEADFSPLKSRFVEMWKILWIAKNRHSIFFFFLFIFNYFAREFSAAQIEFAEQKVNLSLRDELLRELTRDFISIMQFCDCSIGRQFRCLSRIEQWRMVKSEATSTVLNRYLVSMQWQICTINCRMMGDQKKWAS